MEEKLGFTSVYLPDVTDIWDVSELFLECPLFPDKELSDLASVSISL
jgi:hypothetical protein